MTDEKTDKKTEEEIPFNIALGMVVRLGAGVANAINQDQHGPKLNDTTRSLVMAMGAVVNRIAPRVEGMEVLDPKYKDEVGMTIKAIVQESWEQDPKIITDIH